MSDHGTRSRYVQGCRCDGCRGAEREYAAARRARLWAERYVETMPDGTARVTFEPVEWSDRRKKPKPRPVNR